ncbi:hypothetical protein ABTA78_19755, partial [Acinetobacter baumannii]
KNQLPQRLIEPTENFLKVAGAGMGFMGKMAIANQWLLKSLLLKQMEKIHRPMHSPALQLQ